MNSPFSLHDAVLSQEMMLWNQVAEGICNEYLIDVVLDESYDGDWYFTYSPPTTDLCSIATAVFSAHIGGQRKKYYAEISLSKQRISEFYAENPHVMGGVTLMPRFLYTPVVETTLPYLTISDLLTIWRERSIAFKGKVLPPREGFGLGRLDIGNHHIETLPSFGHRHMTDEEFLARYRNDNIDEDIENVAPATLSSDGESVHEFMTLGPI